MIYEEKQCAHIPCQCSAEPGSDYCCVQCAEAANQTDCDCGHPECRAEA